MARLGPGKALRCALRARPPQTAPHSARARGRALLGQVSRVVARPSFVVPPRPKRGRFGAHQTVWAGLRAVRRCAPASPALSPGPLEPRSRALTRDDRRALHADDGVWPEAASPLCEARAQKPDISFALELAWT